MPRQGSSRDTAKEMFWRKAITRQTESGLSRAEFCRREGLKPDVLAWWTKTIAERDAQAAVAKVKAIKQEEKFVSLRVASEEATASSQTSTDDNVQEILRAARRNPIAELCLGEASIRIWRGADRDTVRMLIQALKETSLC